MNEEHAAAVAEIEAVLTDYAEVFEKYTVGSSMGGHVSSVSLLPGALNIASGELIYIDGKAWTVTSTAQYPPPCSCASA